MGFHCILVQSQCRVKPTGIAEVTGSNPVEALIFYFQASLFQLLKLEIHCEDHISPSRVVLLFLVQCHSNF